jgi:tRNA modification GTPase
LPAELVAVDAREGLAALASLTGEDAGEDVLDALFARFCIGK